MLRLDKFTTKSQEAVQKAFELGSEFGHQQIESVHLTYALLQDQEGIVNAILQRLDVSADLFFKGLEEELERKAKVEGGQPPYLSRELNEILNASQKIALEMKDEYVSQEHILLSLVREKETRISQELKRHGFSEQDLLVVLKEIRGGQKVTDIN